MGDLASLLTAIGGLVTALGGTFALVWTTVRTSRRERPDAARRAIEELAASAADGEITPDEIADILRSRDERTGAG